MKSASDFYHLKCPNYRNINEIVSIGDRLHISETLFGDLDAEILILAQDGANFSKIKDLVSIEGAGGYRHGPNVKTNTNLQQCLAPYFTHKYQNYSNVTPKKCGIYYANAIWLLKDSAKMSGNITKVNEVLQICEPVFDATITGLKNLKCIITLGRIPYEFVLRFSKQPSLSWKEALISDPQIINIHNKSIYIGAVFHPSPLSGGRNINKLKDDFKRILIKTSLIN